MKQTKIVTTVGSASDSRETLIKLIQAGMYMARVNMSHGDHDERREQIAHLPDLSAQFVFRLCLWKAPSVFV